MIFCYQTTQLKSVMFVFPFQGKINFKEKLEFFYFKFSTYILVHKWLQITSENHVG